MPHDERRKICFVTGTRAEFGLMRRTLAAIRSHPQLSLQLVVTGMHLSVAHGYTIEQIVRDGWTIDARVPWEQGGGAPHEVARATGLAMAELARVYHELKSDVALVVGDRVEAFAAAAAAQVSQIALAHVHGGDLAEGQVDDSLRHAISKLAHVHLCATEGSSARLIRMGEDVARVHVVGAPGVEGIEEDAAGPHPSPLPGYRVRGPEFATVLFHPTSTDDSIEFARATELLEATLAAVPSVVLIDPNNDPGHRGVLRAWDAAAKDPRVTRIAGSLVRSQFLGLLRDAAVLVGNSSSGIIEAGAFGARVVNIGDRQAGRERGENVVDVSHDREAIERAVRECLRLGRASGVHPYARPATAATIARVLSQARIDPNSLRKRNSY
jgi:UDP-hydrolysing UDP-N-acetyl-D-glucosamine 2-epimerase